MTNELFFVRLLLNLPGRLETENGWGKVMDCHDRLRFQSLGYYVIKKRNLGEDEYRDFGYILTVEGPRHRTKNDIIFLYKIPIRIDMQIS